MAEIEYDDAVRELQQIAQSNWRTGAIADAVQPKYGEKTLARLAATAVSRLRR